MKKDKLFGQQSSMVVQERLLACFSFKKSDIWVAPLKIGNTVDTSARWWQGKVEWGTWGGI